MKRKIFITLFVLLLVGLTPCVLFACGDKDTIIPGKTLVKLITEKGTEQSYVDHETTITLPTLEKEGYAFIGWKSSMQTVRGDFNVQKRDKIELKALFEEDCSKYEKALTLFTSDGSVLEYDEGKFNNVNKKITKLYVKAGYKATLYKRKDFSGKSFSACYKGKYDGKVGSIVIEKIKTTSYECGPLLTNVDKAALLKQFAPVYYFDENEQFFADSVENVPLNMTRNLSQNGYFYEIPGITDPDFVNDYLKGTKTNAKAYAFAVEKEYEFLDLSYFVFFPYNLGKKIGFVRYGNHVGDWEHITVRLKVEKNSLLSTTVTPVFVEYSTHTWRFYVPFDEVEMTEGHPTAYIAEGSHGIWQNAGKNVYLNKIVVVLKDSCSKGYAWKLWEDNQMETYAYDALTWTGTGIGGSKWNTCFDKDYFNPDSNSVIQWGNYKLNKGVFYTRFDNGPNGPQEKPNLYNYYTMQAMQEF